MNIRHMAAAAAVVSSLAMAAPAFAQLAGTPKKIFACDIGSKRVWITAMGSILTYNFGASDKVEMSILASPKSGNIKTVSGRISQVRFINGEYSYAVWTDGGNSGAQIPPSAGLTVYQGKKPISERFCTKFTEFDYDLDVFPEEADEFIPG